MKRYKLKRLVNSDGSTSDFMVVHPVGEWETHEDADEMRQALIYIKDYWNGSPESAVDAIEEAVAMATEVLDKQEGE